MLHMDCAALLMVLMLRGSLIPVCAPVDVQRRFPAFAFSKASVHPYTRSPRIGYPEYIGRRQDARRRTSFFFADMADKPFPSGGWEQWKKEIQSQNQIAKQAFEEERKCMLFTELLGPLTSVRPEDFYTRSESRK